MILGSEKPVTPTVVAGYSKCYNDLKDGGCLAVHKTNKGTGPNDRIVGTLTAVDIVKGSANNQSVDSGLLILDEN